MKYISHELCKWEIFPITKRKLRMDQVRETQILIRFTADAVNSPGGPASVNDLLFT
jgi:hypothetical protein